MSSQSADAFAGSQDERAPQMRDYDALDPVLHPYLGFTSPLNFRSPSVSTDSAGFRLSEFDGKVVSTESVPGDGYGVALGSSFTFGVGATHDRHSVVSRLAEESGKPFLNRAIRAGNSLQELLAALPVLERADDVVACTGVNNLAVAFLSSRTYGDLGPLFYDELIALLAGRRLDELTSGLGGTRLMSRLKTSLSAARVPDQRHGPARPHLAPEEITSDAADRHLRDLRLVVAAAHPAARVIFVLQSFLDPAQRELHPEERELVRPVNGSAREWWSSPVEFAELHWASYTEKLRAGCARIGVPFGMLEASKFDGWAFLDRVHMTDNGQQQAATKIREMMGSGSA
jgi:hypothetical protein